MLNKLSIVYDNNSISLENITTVGIVGDNGVGKTSFLERIALANEDNLYRILNYKGFVSYGKFKVNIDDGEVECDHIEAERVYYPEILYLKYIPTENYSYICAGNIKYNIMMLYPSMLTTHAHYPHYRVQYLDNLGKGLSNLVKLLYMIYSNKPDILLIDDIETLGLHPERLKLFFQLVNQRIQEGYLKAMLFTTNSDAYFYLAEVDETSKFLLLSKGGHEIMDREEVLDRVDYEDLRYTVLKSLNKR